MVDCNSKDYSNGDCQGTTSYLSCNNSKNNSCNINYAGDTVLVICIEKNGNVYSWASILTIDYNKTNDISTFTITINDDNYINKPTIYFVPQNCGTCSGCEDCQVCSNEILPTSINNVRIIINNRSNKKYLYGIFYSYTKTCSSWSCQFLGSIPVDENSKTSTNDDFINKNLGVTYISPGR